MKRWHAEEQLMQARYEAHTAFYGTNSNKTVARGHFRKRHPFDCGHSHCHVCHGLKLQHESTIAHILADEDLREQVQAITSAGLVSQQSAFVLEAFAASI